MPVIIKIGFILSMLQAIHRYRRILGLNPQFIILVGEYDFVVQGQLASGFNSL